MRAGSGVVSRWMGVVEVDCRFVSADDELVCLLAGGFVKSDVLPSLLACVWCIDGVRWDGISRW